MMTTATGATASDANAIRQSTTSNAAKVINGTRVRRDRIGEVVRDERLNLIHVVDGDALQVTARARREERQRHVAELVRHTQTQLVKNVERRDVREHRRRREHHVTQHHRAESPRHQTLHDICGDCVRGERGSEFRDDERGHQTERGADDREESREAQHQFLRAREVQQPTETSELLRRSGLRRLRITDRRSVDDQLVAHAERYVSF